MIVAERTGTVQATESVARDPVRTKPTFSPVEAGKFEKLMALFSRGLLPLLKEGRIAWNDVAFLAGLFAHHGKATYPAISTVSAKVGLNYRTSQRCVRRLLREDLIAFSPESKGRKTHRYRPGERLPTCMQDVNFLKNLDRAPRPVTRKYDGPTMTNCRGSGRPTTTKWHPIKNKTNTKTKGLREIQTATAAEIRGAVVKALPSLTQKPTPSQDKDAGGQSGGSRPGRGVGSSLAGEAFARNWKELKGRAAPTFPVLEEAFAGVVSVWQEHVPSRKVTKSVERSLKTFCGLWGVDRVHAVIGGFGNKIAHADNPLGYLRGLLTSQAKTPDEEYASQQEAQGLHEVSCRICGRKDWSDKDPWTCWLCSRKQREQFEELRRKRRSAVRCMGVHGDYDCGKVKEFKRPEPYDTDGRSRYWEMRTSLFGPYMWRCDECIALVPPEEIARLTAERKAREEQLMARPH